MYHLKSDGIPSSWLLCSFDMTLFNFNNFLAFWHSKISQTLHSAADGESAISLRALIPFSRELSLGSRTELHLWPPPPIHTQPTSCSAHSQYDIFAGNERSTINHYESLVKIHLWESRALPLVLTLLLRFPLNFAHPVYAVPSLVRIVIPAHASYPIRKFPSGLSLISALLGPVFCQFLTFHLSQTVLVLLKIISGLSRFTAEEPAPEFLFQSENLWVCLISLVSTSGGAGRARGWVGVCCWLSMSLADFFLTFSFLL